MNELKQLLINHKILQSLGKGYTDLYDFQLRENIRKCLDEIMDDDHIISYREVTEGLNIKCSDFEKKCMKCYYKEDNECCELNDWLIILSYILEEMHTLIEKNQTQAFYNCLYRRWSRKFLHINPRIIFEYYVLNQINNSN